MRRDSSLRLVQRGLLAAQPQSSSQPSICLQCRSLLLRRPTLVSASLQRPSQAAAAAQQFSTSTGWLKKSSSSNKSSRKSPEVTPPKKEGHVPDNMATRGRDSELDPYDFTDLNDKIAKAISRLKDGLVKTRDAGRVTPAMVESLPVEINVKGHDAHGASPHKERTKIGDLASVTPRGGRMVQVFCAEQAQVKPICSSIIGSPHSLVPQVDQHNPLLVLVPVPPMTAETRAQARAEAKKVFDRASLDVRNARGDAQKRFRKMENQKLVIVDELHKAHKQMEEIVRKAQDECKKHYDGAVKAMEG
ncbi:hypothetical protein A1O3_09194 [Capronia epimyces CBS 606.96]|uniref:Ribosome recycling factor domain-containing protein n=1 Tax=Capronia epimyces CBS 606.96 TaxID=1182542 RepID=W9Y6I7_9EURO|nr:uncharacterized protein A1O3_09194 [Capronia epimyces CBS 606.96]EXJ78034.1 hypothetical protein A1O3_09194 [Capronia epimyces CBS 606.96]